MAAAADLRGLQAVEARGLTKHYRLGEHVSLRATLDALRGRRPSYSDDDPGEVVTALADVSFAVDRGECLGIVGTNGSGKSTVVQVISGITVPDDGAVTVRGRVLPLLSVGSGFHQELTGRENVRLFGAILGIEDDAVEANLDRIAAFAEVESHLDTPMKRYSDGMQARLSFAIGVLFPADVYIFDEVLAVVDGEFVDRCLAAITGLVESGRTVLFVSHNIAQVTQLCDRVLWLDAGRVRRLGGADEVVRDYLAELHGDWVPDGRPSATTTS